MAERTIRLQRRFGVQLRQAVDIARMVRRLRSQVTLVTTKRADARSAYDVLMLGAQRGSEITVRAEGPDAEVAVQRLAELFSDGSGI